MNKPPDPSSLSHRTAAHIHLALSSSMSSADFPCFMPCLLIFPATLHHFLPFCQDLPLLQRIWQRFWICPFNSLRMMRITETLVVFRIQSVKVPVLPLPDLYLSPHHTRVKRSFLGFHLSPQRLSTGEYWLLPKGCISRSSYNIYGMRWIWRLLGGSGSIQGCLQWLCSPLPDGDNRSLMDSQSTINTFPGVVVPLSLPLLPRVNCMFMACLSSGYAICGLFKPLEWTRVMHPTLSCFIYQRTPMSDLSPTSPLSFSSDSNDSSVNVQNNVPITDPSAQPSDTAVLDGLRPNHITQSFDPARPTFSDALKFGVGSHGGGLNPISQPISSFQSRGNEHSRVFLMGDSSNPSQETSSVHHSQPKRSPALNIDEFSAMCLLGKVWGEAITLSAIIHRTRNDWKFTKGQIEYVDLGNEWVLIRFANSQDRDLVFSQRPWYVNGFFLEFSGLTVQWELSSYAHSHFVIDLHSLMKVTTLVCNDQFVVIFYNQIHHVMLYSPLHPNLVGPIVLYFLWLSYCVCDWWVFMAYYCAFFILCCLSSVHMSDQVRASLVIRTSLALFVFTCYDCVCLIPVLMATWTESLLCTYHPRLIECRSTTTTYYCWDCLEQYQKLFDRWCFIFKIKVIGSQCDNPHLASLSGVVFVFALLLWLDLFFVIFVAMIFHICLMASEHFGFYDLESGSKAFYPTAFGPRIYGTRGYPVSKKYYDTSWISNAIFQQQRHPTIIGLASLDQNKHITILICV